MKPGYNVPMSASEKEKLAANAEKENAVRNMNMAEIAALDRYGWNRKFYERNTAIYVKGVKRIVTLKERDELLVLDAKPKPTVEMPKKDNPAVVISGTVECKGCGNVKYNLAPGPYYCTYCDDSVYHRLIA